MTTEVSAFELSRAYAAGWKAASMLPSEKAKLSEKDIERLNPHKSDPSKARWRTGFDDALKR